MAKAQARYDYIPVLWVERFDGIQVVVVSCSDYDEFRRLPGAIEYEGTIHGLTGWNSDSRIACFRSDAAVAKEVAR